MLIKASAKPAITAEGMYLMPEAAAYDVVSVRLREDFALRQQQLISVSDAVF